MLAGVGCQPYSPYEYLDSYILWPSRAASWIANLDLLSGSIM
jgi:hypothetical protein